MGVEEACAENDAAVGADAAPEVRQIDRVKGISAGEADGFELGFCEGLGCDGESEFGFGAALERGEIQREGVGGE